MALRWRHDSDAGGWTAVLEGGAWDGSDVDVGRVSRSLRPASEPSGWQARYWGRDESRRYHLGTGSDPAAVGGLWPSAEEAMAAVEEAHDPGSTCE